QGFSDLRYEIVCATTTGYHPSRCSIAQVPVLLIMSKRATSMTDRYLPLFIWFSTSRSVGQTRKRERETSAKRSDPRRGAIRNMCQTVRKSMCMVGRVSNAGEDRA